MGKISNRLITVLMINKNDSITLVKYTYAISFRIKFTLHVSFISSLLRDRLNFRLHVY